MLVYDIGANVGAFTDHLLKKQPDCNIILVEANPELSIYLNNKYKDNKNIKILNFAVSTNDQQEIDFYISNSNTISTASKDWINNSRFSKNYNWNTVVKIKTITLDKMIQEFGTPDLIKIDVEGYELEVVRGLTKKSSKICFEWAEEQYKKINKTCEHLMSIGYSHFGFIEQDEYLIEPDKYGEWKTSNFHSNIVPERKERWGMIWAK